MAFAAAKLEDEQAARVLYERMAPYADIVLTIGLPCEVIAPLHMPMATLAAALGDWTAFEHHAAVTMEWLESAGAVPWRAMAQFVFADLLLGAGQNERASALLDAAHATARDSGFTRLEERVAQLQARTG
jgi:hypothetical protein